MRAHPPGEPLALANVVSWRRALERGQRIDCWTGRWPGNGTDEIEVPDLGVAVGRAVQDHLRLLRSPNDGSEATARSTKLFAENANRFVEKAGQLCDRSEESRVGNRCDRKCRFGWSPVYTKK